jgi:predicted nucleotidyltransferase component of viral defense system
MVSSCWSKQSATIITYELDERLATKLRALYPRRKRRDLFDLALALKNTSTDPDKVVELFERYKQREELYVNRAMFERHMLDKLDHPQFGADIRPLLRPEHKWEVVEAYNEVANKLIARLPGKPWRG